jgi:hypothetical protein
MLPLRSSTPRIDSIAATRRRDTSRFASASAAERASDQVEGRLQPPERIAERRHRRHQKPLWWAAASHPVAGTRGRCSDRCDLPARRIESTTTNYDREIKRCPKIASMVGRLAAAPRLIDYEP